MSKTAGRKKSYLDREDLPRGMRNNNPGNLVLTSIEWKGKIPEGANTDGKFEQFVEYRFGVRALLKDLINDIEKGKDTIEQLIYEYAPPFENRTEGYITFVTEETGINRDAKIGTNPTVLYPLVKAIGEIENGQPAINKTDFNHAWDLI